MNDGANGYVDGWMMWSVCGAGEWIENWNALIVKREGPWEEMEWNWDETKRKERDSELNGGGAFENGEQRRRLAISKVLRGFSFAYYAIAQKRPDFILLPWGNAVVAGNDPLPFFHSNAIEHSSAPAAWKTLNSSSNGRKHFTTKL